MTPCEHTLMWKKRREVDAGTMSDAYLAQNIKKGSGASPVGCACPCSSRKPLWISQETKDEVTSELLLVCLLKSHERLRCCAWAYSDHADLARSIVARLAHEQ